MVRDSILKGLMDALKAKYDKYVSDTAAQNAYKIAYDKWKVVAYAPGVLSANFCLSGYH